MEGAGGLTRVSPGWDELPLNTKHIAGLNTTTTLLYNYLVVCQWVEYNHNITIYYITTWLSVSGLNTTTTLLYNYLVVCQWAEYNHYITI